MALDVETVNEILAMLEGFMKSLEERGNQEGAQMVYRVMELIRAL